MSDIAPYVRTYFKFNPIGGFGPIFQSSLRGGKIGASTTKCFERSRIFRYGLPKDILSKGQKTKAGGGGVQPQRVKSKNKYLISFK